MPLLGSLASLAVAFAPTSPLPQAPDEIGAWGTCLHNWITVMGPGTPIGGPIFVSHPVDEVAHAALIPTGPKQGQVLLWNFNTQDHTARTFVFDPTTGSCGPPPPIIELSQQLSSNIFCSGHTFLPDGSLLVAGGIPDQGTAAHVFRFSTRNLQWRELQPMDVERYYPSVLLLNRRALSTAGGVWQTPGSSVMVLGGPPGLGTTSGQPLWETLGGIPDAWQRIAPGPISFNPPTWCPPGTIPGHPYAIEQLGCIDLGLDSYPRALQLSRGDIFIAGDVDTSFGYYAAYGDTPAGRTWFIRPPGVGVAQQWAIHEGPWMGGPNATQATANRRQYAPSVLLHELAKQDRVLTFGGADDEVLPTTPPLHVLRPTATVDELVYTYTQQDPTGVWAEKAPMLRSRYWANAVVLPTREILLTGGLEVVVDGGVAQAQPVHPPELYEPGLDHFASGSSKFTAMPPLHPVEGQPNLPHVPIPRLYHHVAMLLPDGRVLIAGGRKHQDLPTMPPLPASKHNAEIYSPPYLFQGTRPVVDDLPEQAALSAFGAPSTFEITVVAPAEDVFDRLVLLRPASVTHHFDADQRYIELQATITDVVYSQPYPSGPAMQTATLSVAAPDEMLAPQGYYMLFAVYQKPTPGHRVPSVGQFIRFM